MSTTSFSCDETYFKRFDLERVCIDKVFFVVYDGDYVKDDHPFDKDLRDRFIHHVKQSRIKKGRAEEVIRRENNYSSWELQLRNGRIMRFHVNIIHYLQDKHGLKPRNVIYDDNFMPIDVTLKCIDYVAALRVFIQNAMSFYIDFVLKHWGVELQDVRYKLSAVEVPFEVYPASVDDISRDMYAKGLSFARYNTQSGTIYLDKKTSDNELFVNKKYENSINIDDYDLEPSPDIIYINRINSGRSGHKTQIKIYQKTFGLVRIESTLYSDDLKRVFRYDRGDTDEIITETLIHFIHFILNVNGINPSRYDRSLDDIVKFLAISYKESEDLIYSLRGIDFFEACRANRSVRQRLVRKGLIQKKVDNDNKRQNGVYIVNPIIKDFLNLYKPRGNEHFVRGGLFPDL